MPFVQDTSCVSPVEFQKSDTGQLVSSILHLGQFILCEDRPRQRPTNCSLHSGELGKSFFSVVTDYSLHDNTPLSASDLGLRVRMEPDSGAGVFIGLSDDVVQWHRQLMLFRTPPFGGKVTMADKPEFHALIYRFEERLPYWMMRSSRFLRQPTSRLWRVPAAALLIVGGALGFLPILGFWMVPLGLLLLAVDLPVLRPPLVRLMRWIEHKWPPAASGKPK